MHQNQEIEKENWLLKEDLHQIIGQEVEVNPEEEELLIFIILSQNLKKILDQVQD